MLKINGLRNKLARSLSKLNMSQAKNGHSCLVRQVLNELDSRWHANRLVLQRLKCPQKRMAGPEL